MAKVDQNGDFLIDEEELCEYIVKQLGIDSDTVSMILDAEMAILESKGLVLEEKPASPGSNEMPVGKVDTDELNAYVVSHTGLNQETVESILDTEMLYLEEHGVAGPLGPSADQG